MSFERMPLPFCFLSTAIPLEVNKVSSEPTERMDLEFLCLGGLNSEDTSWLFWLEDASFDAEPSDSGSPSLLGTATRFPRFLDSFPSPFSLSEDFIGSAPGSFSDLSNASAVDVDATSADSSSLFPPSDMIKSKKSSTSVHVKPSLPTEKSGSVSKRVVSLSRVDSDIWRGVAVAPAENRISTRNRRGLSIVWPVSSKSRMTICVR
mmetsp:Transcript_7863/g.14558  ORF Transcript_7863/g.14558 Transcript_7863/m.14558 type:complete len:206 (+) Transcript_7863:694-1311(+)